MPEKNTTLATADGVLLPPTGSVVVRMYNVGFGDCFLLAFPAGSGKARYVLIDCGLHPRWKGGKERLALVASDIARATGNHLHVVAVTHEHTDHISGFLYGQSIFAEMKIDNLWLAWTEDPEDSLGKQLKMQHSTRMQALNAATRRLMLVGNPLGERLERILDFDRDLDRDLASGRNENAMNNLRAQVKKKLERPEDYLAPGRPPLALPGIEGVKCYVLGPPRDRESLKKLEAQKEMYLDRFALNGDTAFLAGALASSGTTSPEDGDLVKRSYPFDESLLIPESEAFHHPQFGKFFRQHYGSCKGEKNGPEWRRIDWDWLDSAGQIALSLNSMTNNTSLVLAFELTETDPSKVLLFSGDAQVGNWLSWQNLEWKRKGRAAKSREGETEQESNGKLTGADLLARVVLYKVGHHGSRNGTLRWKGLEMMKSSELVAMLPVHERWAREMMAWDHPDRRLLARIMEKARGRVLRSDRIPQTGSMTRPSQATEGEWNSFLRRVQWDKSPEKLWIQYTVT